MSQIILPIKINTTAILICLQLLSVLFVPTEIIYAQSVTHITTSQGLTTNDLTLVVKDHQNFMWIGSTNGLSKHEGSRIRVYSKIGKDSTSLSANEMHTLFEDKYGFIWIGTTGGLDKLNPSTNIITHYKLNSGNKISPSIGYILSITQDKYDSIWVSTSVGFFRMDYKTGIYNKIVITEKDGSGVPLCNTGYRKGITTENGVWFYTDKGMIYYEYNSHSFFHKYYNPQHKPVFNLGNIYSQEGGSDICLGKNGNIYFIAASRLLVTYNFITEQLDSVSLPFPKDAWHCCYSVVLDSHNNIWIGFRHGGILVYNTTTKSFSSIINDESHHLLSSNYVYSICKDYLGKMWVATNNGLDIIDYYNNGIADYTLSYKPDYLDLKYESTIISQNKSIIHIPFYESGAFNFNTKNNNVTFHPVANLHHQSISYIITDTNGNNYITSKNNICTIQFSTNGFSTSVYKNVLNKILTERNERIAWSTASDNKQIYKTTSGRIYIVENNTIIDELDGGGFMKQASLSYNKKSLFYLTSQDELIHYNLTNKLADTIKIGEMCKKIDFVFAIPRDVLDDGKNNIWITSQNGLLKYNLAAHHLASFNTTNNLSHNFTFALALDQYGAVWVASLGGIDKYDDQKNTFKSIASFQSSNYMNAFGSSIYGEDSMIYFLSGNKLYRINPTVYKNNIQHQELLSINAFLVNGKLSISEIDGKKYSFNYEQTRFEFQFGLLDFINQKRVKYFYYLEGLEETWIDANNKSEVVYNAMQPGKYIFHVKAIDAGGEEVTNQITIPFEIKPPFWNTIFFYLICIVTLGALIYYFERWRISNIKKLQQAKIDMLSINEKLSGAKLEALRSQMNPHFIFNSLNAIQECILTNKVDAAYEYLSKFSKLQRLVLNNSAKEFIPLGSELEMLKLYLSLESLRFSQSFTQEIMVDKNLDIDEIMFPSMLLQPYVENAIWHGLRSKEGEKLLTIHCSETNKQLIITIDDNGIGREKAAAIKQQKLGAAKFESKGRVLSAERMKILALKYNAQIVVNTIDKLNNIGEAIGTTIIISIPLHIGSLKS